VPTQPPVQLVPGLIWPPTPT